VTELQTTSVAKPWEGLDGRDRHAACMVAAQQGDRMAFDILVAELSPLHRSATADDCAEAIRVPVEPAKKRSTEQNARASVRKSGPMYPP